MREGFSSYPQLSFNDFLARLEQSLPDLPEQEARLAQYMLLNADALSLETGRSLAARAGASEVTVGRLLRRLGCDGMKGLKAMLRERYAVSSDLGALSRGWEPIEASKEATLKAEIAGLHAVFRQASGPEWQRVAGTVGAASTVYVTGFQSVRGIAEDFGRRLAIARAGVRYLSAHDGMLAEWLLEQAPAEQRESTCLVLIDVVPYASEANSIVQIAKRQGRRVVVVSDEFCHWAGELADAVLHAPSRTGLFLESTVSIVAILNLLVDAVAARDPESAQMRIDHWPRLARELKLF